MEAIVFIYFTMFEDQSQSAYIFINTPMEI